MDGGVIFGSFVAVAAAAALALFLLRGRKLALAEANLTPLMSTFCWVSLGNLGFWARGNFRVRLAIYPEFLVLGFFSPVVIRFSELAKIELRESFLSGRQLCISTARGVTYRLVVKNPDEVAKLLRTGGGSIDKQSAWTCSKCREENPRNLSCAGNAKQQDRVTTANKRVPQCRR